MRAFPTIPLVFPGCYFLCHPALTVQLPVQALTVHDIDLSFRHVQPTTVLGGVVELDLVQDPTRFLRLDVS
jgi:hypothetical protein